MSVFTFVVIIVFNVCILIGAIYSLLKVTGKIDKWKRLKKERNGLSKKSINFSAMKKPIIAFFVTITLVFSIGYVATSEECARCHSHTPYFTGEMVTVGARAKLSGYDYGTDIFICKNCINDFERFLDENPDKRGMYSLGQYQLWEEYL